MNITVGKKQKIVVGVATCVLMSCVAEGVAWILGFVVGITVHLDLPSLLLLAAILSFFVLEGIVYGGSSFAFLAGMVSGVVHYVVLAAEYTVLFFFDSHSSYLSVANYLSLLLVAVNACVATYFVIVRWEKKVARQRDK